MPGANNVADQIEEQETGARDNLGRQGRERMRAANSDRSRGDAHACFHWSDLLLGHCDVWRIGAQMARVAAECPESAERVVPHRALITLCVMMAT